MEKFYNPEKLNGLSDLTFTFGDAAESLSAILKTECPSGRLALVAFSNTRERFIEKLMPAVSAASAKITSIVMPNPSKNTLEYIGQAFQLPDDVRLVIVLDRELFRTASYYATVKNVPLVFIPINACLSGALEKSFFIKNGKTLDLVSGERNVKVVVDKTLLSESVSDAYAFNMARLITLIDYRVMSASGGEIDPKAFIVAREGVNGTYGIMTENISLRPLCALYNGLKIAVFDRRADFIKASSERVSASLLSGVPPLPKYELFCMVKLLELYKSAFKVKKEVEAMPDYVIRAEKVSALLDTSESQANGSLAEQIAFVRGNLPKFVDSFNSLKSEAEELFLCADNILSTYYALSGDKKVEVNADSIRYGGDTPFGANVLSVFRELGITDFKV